MGAQEFIQKSKGKTAREAFDNAVQQAQYDFGHAGYTGSMAEKSDYVLIWYRTGKIPLNLRTTCSPMTTKESTINGARPVALKSPRANIFSLVGRVHK